MYTASTEIETEHPDNGILVQKGISSDINRFRNIEFRTKEPFFPKNIVHFFFEQQDRCVYKNNLSADIKKNTTTSKKQCVSNCRCSKVLLVIC